MLQFSAISNNEKIDSENGIIRGVVVMEVGEAKGHDVQLDSGSLDSFMKLVATRPDGVKVRFGNDHKAGVEDTNGTLKNFRLDGNKLRADLHLLKTDSRNVKLLEMAQRMPNEFGLSAVTDAEKRKTSKGEYEFISPIRFTQVDCVDIVSSPAATKGLFFSQNHNQKTMTKIALALGLPETATEAEIEVAAKLALEAKEKMCKYEAEAEAKKKLEAEEEAKKKKLEAEADDEEKGKQGKKKFSEELEAVKLELAEIKKNDADKLAAAHKAEVESIKLEAGRDGKVIPISDEALLKLSVVEVREMVAKLPKGQLKLAKGTQPVGKDNKPLDKKSPEFKAYLSQRREEGALALGQKMTQN